MLPRSALALLWVAKCTGRYMPRGTVDAPVRRLRGSTKPWARNERAMHVLTCTRMYMRFM